MTPPLQWVFLLALVGRITSIPVPLTDDACALLCHPMTRLYPEGVCKLRGAQSGSVLDQARIIASRCLNLCDQQLPFSVEVSCHVLRSFLGSLRGCHCSSTNTMYISARIPSLVNELAGDIVSAISPSSLGGRVICALSAALLLEDVDVEEISLDADCQPDRLIQDAENVKTDRHNVEYSPKDLDGTGLVEGDQENITAASDSSEESTVDWDQWCISQCNNGRGGNACRCDLIP